MTVQEIVNTALEMAEEECIEVARRILASLSDSAAVGDRVAEGIARIEAVLTGITPGLTDEEFLARLG